MIRWSFPQSPVVSRAMTSAVPDILARIVEHKRLELRDASVDLQSLEIKAHTIRRRDFAAALKSAPPAIIAEIKKASPSKGILAGDFEPAVIADAYGKGGAAAISVLTDQRFFGGSLEDLVKVRKTVPIPVLRKDFTIDRYHVAEAAANGADAILLITAVLSDAELRDFREYAETFGMAALVEVHDELELTRAIASGAKILGVNNRDLRTFEVRLETSLRLAELMPGNVVRVSESGIRSSADVQRLRAAGYHAFLVGEHLMKSSDAAAAIQELRQ
jgi:indole-3-glycerol phosphate synthase